MIDLAIKNAKHEITNGDNYFSKITFCSNGFLLFL